MHISLKGNLYLAGLQIIVIKLLTYSLYSVVSVIEEVWVSPWFVYHAKNVILGAYNDGGHFNCYIVEARLFNA